MLCHLRRTPGALFSLDAASLRELRDVRQARNPKLTGKTSSRSVSRRCVTRPCRVMTVGSRESGSRLVVAVQIRGIALATGSAVGAKGAD